MANPRSPDRLPRPRGMRRAALATGAAVLMASIAATTQALLHPVPLVALDVGPATGP